jgi:hypothetical protein
MNNEPVSLFKSNKKYSRLFKEKDKQLKELRKIVRKYLKETMSVPMRAVDCNQPVVMELEDQLKKLSNYKGK